MKKKISFSVKVLLFALKAIYTIWEKPELCNLVPCFSNLQLKFGKLHIFLGMFILLLFRNNSSPLLKFLHHYCHTYSFRKTFGFYYVADIFSGTRDVMEKSTENNPFSESLSWGIGMQNVSNSSIKHSITGDLLCFTWNIQGIRKNSLTSIYIDPFAPLF